MADPGGPVPAPSGAPLGRRFFLGSVYVSAGGWLTSALNFAIGIGLARLLGPEAMGFYALVFSINMLINMIGAFSPGLAVIQAREESQRRYDTASALAFAQALAGLGLTAIVALFVAAQHSAAAGWFLLWLAAARFPSFVQQVPLAVLERRFRYRTVASLGFLTANVPNLAALGLAWLGAGAASLLARDLLMAGLGFLLASLTSGYRFRGQVDRQTASEIMAFGRPMFLSRALEIVLDRADRLLVGSFLGDLTLGLYNQARFLAESAVVATRPLGRLSFNLYSRLQGQPERLARAYDIVNFFMVRLVFAGVATLTVYPEETIRLLLGAEWTPAAPLLRWLALYGGLLPVFENMKLLLYGRGDVGVNVRLRLVQLAILLAGASAGVATGRIGVVAGTLVAMSAVGVLLAAHATRDLVAQSMRRVFAVPLAVVAGVCAALLLAPPLPGISALPWWLLPVVPGALYAAVLILVERGRMVQHARYLAAIVRPAS